MTTAAQLPKAFGRAALIASLTALTLSIGAPAEAACKRFGFLVNDYGKDGPSRDAQALLDKRIGQIMAAHKIAKFSTGPKTVTCEMFLNFIVFDEYTCTAEAQVCWEGPMPADLAGSDTPPTKAAKGSATAAATPGAAAPGSDSAKTKAAAPKKAPVAAIPTGSIPVPKAPAVAPAAKTVPAPAAPAPAIPAAVTPPAAPVAPAAPAAPTTLPVHQPVAAPAAPVAAPAPVAAAPTPPAAPAAPAAPVAPAAAPVAPAAPAPTNGATQQ